MAKPRLYSHLRIQDEFGSYLRPGWCQTHGDFAWGYDDDSVGCFYQCIVESGSHDCVFIPGALALPRGTLEKSKGQ